MTCLIADTTRCDLRLVPDRVADVPEPGGGGVFDDGFVEGLRARCLDDLRIPPANRLEALHGDRTGQHSIHINRQWRICFVWGNGDADAVEIVDHH